jgi:hypothetical protein
MNFEALQTLTRDQAEFKKAFRKADETNEVVPLIKGTFVQGRTPYIHVAKLPDGSEIRLKFYNTVKKLFNSKNVELIGKESFLSYLEVTVAPVGIKGYFYTTDVVQVVWAPSRTKALVKHEAAIANLLAQAAALGIDLSAPTSWATTYTENY